MRYLAPADAFAAVALFDGSTYPVTAQATERTRVRAWSREVLPGLVRDHPRFEANLLRIVSSHTREALSRVRELSTETVPRGSPAPCCAWDSRSEEPGRAAPSSSSGSASRISPRSPAPASSP